MEPLSAETSSPPRAKTVRRVAARAQAHKYLPTIFTVYFVALLDRLSTSCYVIVAMADLPATLSFKASTRMVERLRLLAREHHWTVGNLIRILLEKALQERQAREAKEVND